jgi:predicted nucleotidyltransferase component of viral defense system
MPFLHQLPNIIDLFQVVANERKLLPVIVEKDYWLMHCLWGIQQQKFKFELKGGTSLSKGFGIIERFSEDIDIQIHPENDEVKTGKNQDKPTQIESRAKFFEDMTKKLNIPGLTFSRETNFDDLSGKMRSGGIKAEYSSLFSEEASLKEGVILELGFDQTTPFTECNISSWLFDKALSLKLDVTDNRAKSIPCYNPEYTFVEKLQTISTKFRQEQEKKIMPINFLRHYYDVYKLLEDKRVLDFIGTEKYEAHKKVRFRGKDEIIIKNNPAFTIQDKTTRNLYSKEFIKKIPIYFGKQPTFEEILNRIEKNIERL